MKAPPFQSSSKTVFGLVGAVLLVGGVTILTVVAASVPGEARHRAARRHSFGAKNVLRQSFGFSLREAGPESKPGDLL